MCVCMLVRVRVCVCVCVCVGVGVGVYTSVWVCSLYKDCCIISDLLINCPPIVICLGRG